MVPDSCSVLAQTLFIPMPGQVSASGDGVEDQLGELARQTLLMVTVMM